MGSYSVLLHADTSKMRNILKKLTKSRPFQIFLVVFKLLLILVSLYFFICSLSFLSDSFRLVGGKNIGAFFADSTLLNNPVVGVMIGVLVTVLVQSSSTSTTIIVGLAATDVPVKTAIPMIMGANIGTSVTNTIVSFTQMSDREEFKRAFAAATVHDMFNWLTVILLVIVEKLTGFLEFLSDIMVEALINSKTEGSKSPDFLKVLTKPFTKSVIQLDKKVLQGWASNDPEFGNVTTVLKTHCQPDCSYLFSGLGPAGSELGDVAIGLVLLVVSLVMLCGCLLGLVKLLNSLLGEKVKAVISRYVNQDLPLPYLAWLTGYLAMLVGAVMTVLVQSSSVFTSTLTPLAGTGLVSLERVYPLTLGSNIGTTTTSLLAALASKGNERAALQIALVHLLFNITGILLFYPVPVLRLPVPMARKLGEITSQYRWFSVLYLLLMFFLLPAIIFSLSLAGTAALATVLIIVAVVTLMVVTLNICQKYKAKILPEKFRPWDFLPEPLHSLEPYDRIVVKLNCFRFCMRNRERSGEAQEERNNYDFSNNGFQEDHP